MKDILKNILPKVDELDILKDETNNFVKKFNNLKYVTPIVGGSYAKGTSLSGNKEIDLFIKFDYNKYSNKDISSELKKLLNRKKIKFEIIHGSRDYFHFFSKGILFEIIPVLDIKNYKYAENVTDISPLHVSYVKKNTNIKLKNDIRLLKQFCKANRLYGAESHIRGFSGYVLEVLVIYYGSFNKLLNSVKKWSSKEILDPAKHYSSKNEILLNLINSKKSSPLIIIDPVQKNRNIAAGLSDKSFNDFINLIKKYDGSNNFFYKKDINFKKFKGYNIFQITPHNGKKDIVGAKLLKSLEKTKRAIENKGLKVYDYGWEWTDYAYFWFKTDKKLPVIKKHYGPKVDMKVHLKKFKKKWKGKRLYRNNGRYYVNMRRDKVISKNIIEDILERDDIKSNFVKQKIYK